MAVLHIDFMSQSLNRTVPMKVVIPTDKVYFPGMKKRNEQKPFKTLYLLHGVIGSCNDWLYGSNIQRWAEDADLAVVMPSGENSSYTDQPWNHNYYGKFVGEEIVEFTRRTFPLSEKREDTYIGGLSMGGYGALRAALRYRQTFGAVVALSSAFFLNEDLLKEPDESPYFINDPNYRHCIFGPDFKAALESENNIEVLIKRMIDRKESFPAIFMACGLQDSLLDSNRKFSRLLSENGIDHIFIEDQGGHEWDFWNRYIKCGLDWLPLEEVNVGVGSGNVGGI